MPMPRFTSMPARSSFAMRRAITIWGSMMASIRDQIVDNWPRCHHVIRCDHADRDNVIRVRYDDVACHSDHRIEVACGQRIGEVAQVVRQEGMDQCEVCVQCRFQQIRLSTDLDAALVFLDDGSDTGRRQYSAKATAGGSDPF